MNDYILYILEASIGTAILYLIYVSFFSKETFYQRNRWYLIITLILPMILPFLRIDNLSGSNERISAFIANVEFNIPGYQSAAGVSESANSLSIYNIIFVIYIFIATVFLLRVIISCIGTYMIIRRGNINRQGFPKIVISEAEHPAFSFFPYIVLTKKTYDDEYYPDILKHEDTHVRQGHTFDLLLCEIITAFQWFNPLIYFVKRSMVQNHEYIADNYLLRNSNKIKEYQYRLLRIQTKYRIIPLVHSFNNLIKNRLVMINKKPTPNFALLKNLLILPILTFLIVFFSCTAGPANTENQVQPLSESSIGEIRNFLQENIIYPAEAIGSSEIGVVFVKVSMKKGGIITECEAFTGNQQFDAPMLGEIVITGYKSAEAENNAESPAEPILLINECKRVANELVELDIPEWKESDTEFVLTFNFRLV